MPVISKTSEVITALKRVKAEKNLTFQAIYDQIEQAGEHVALSTIKRVFAEGSEDLAFRYESSVKPIAEVLLKLNDAREHDSTGSATSEAMREIIELKNLMLQQKDEEIAELEAEIEKVRAEQQKKIDFLKEEMKSKDKLLDERRDFIYSKDASNERLEKKLRNRSNIIGILGVFIFLFMALIITALIADYLNGDRGFFWLENTFKEIINGNMNIQL